MFDYLIVGAGFAGSVLAERLASQLGKRVLLCDRRSHVGGNAYDCFDEAGLLVHKYGAHAFHTASARIFEYLSRFTTWRAYEHRVMARVADKLVPFPINVDTINTLYGTNLSPEAVGALLEERAERIGRPRNAEEAILSKIGRELYELFFRGHTRKMWGLDPSELHAAVAPRVRARADRDPRYFSDEYQAMPVRGFTHLFENMLDHRNISILLRTDYRDVVGEVPFREMIYTGPIDEFFGYRFGKLPYRSLELRFETHDVAQFQPAAVVHHPDERVPYTRVVEFKHLTGQAHPKTTVAYELPRGDGEPFYPIPRRENAELYRRYKCLADAQGGVRFVGRLASYRYYNMDQVVGQALAVFDQIRGDAAPPRAA